MSWRSELDEFLSDKERGLGRLMPNTNGTSLTLKILLGVVAVILPLNVSWVWWATNEIFTIKANQAIHHADVWTATMYIEAQSVIAEKNLDMKRLSPTDVRKIQRENYPYDRSALQGRP